MKSMRAAVIGLLFLSYGALATMDDGDVEEMISHISAVLDKHKADEVFLSKALPALRAAIHDFEADREFIEQVLPLLVKIDRLGCKLEDVLTASDARWVREICSYYGCRDFEDLYIVFNINARALDEIVE